MKSPCQVTIFRCTDALLVRNDIVTREDEARVRVLSTDQPLATLGPAFSDGMIQAPSNETPVRPSAQSPSIRVVALDSTGRPTGELATISPIAIVSPKWPEDVPYPRPPNRPVL